MSGPRLKINGQDVGELLIGTKGLPPAGPAPASLNQGVVTVSAAKFGTRPVAAGSRTTRDLLAPIREPEFSVLVPYGSAGFLPRGRRTDVERDQLARGFEIAPPGVTLAESVAALAPLGVRFELILRIVRAEPLCLEGEGYAVGGEGLSARGSIVGPGNYSHERLTFAFGGWGSSAAGTSDNAANWVALPVNQFPEVVSAYEGRGVLLCCPRWARLALEAFGWRRDGVVRYDSPSTNLRRVDQDAMNTCRRALPLLAASQEARDALEAVEALRVMKRVERPRTFGLEIDDWSGVRALLIDLVERWRSTCDAQKRARSTK